MSPLYLSFIFFFFFFFNDTATTEIYTLSLHDALPIYMIQVNLHGNEWLIGTGTPLFYNLRKRSEEHTSELQSLTNLVCRLLLEKKKKITKRQDIRNKRRTNASAQMQIHYEITAENILR